MKNYQFTHQNSKRELHINLCVAKFDAAKVSEFKEQLEKNWSETIESVILNFAQVRFIDSSGIGALLGIHKRLNTQETPIVIENANTHVEEVIKLLRLQRIFTIK